MLRGDFASAPIDAQASLPPTPFFEWLCPAMTAK
jgi:hypothetical protein